MKTDKLARKYFWDVDFPSINLTKNKRFVIERILESGDEAAVAWLNKNFSKEDIIEVIKSSRRLSPRSRNYWGLIYNLWQLPSFKKLLARQPGGIWKS